MDNRIYKVEQVAEMLELHPKTVRRYIREGKLNARKVGGQWRIRDEDLNSLMESEERRLSAKDSYSSDYRGDTFEKTSSENNGENKSAPAQNRGKINVSAVIDIYQDADQAFRTSSTIVAVLSSRDPERGQVKYNHIYYPGEGKARYILWGRPLFISEMMKVFNELFEESD